MLNRYDILFRIRLRHEYHRGLAADMFRLQPDMDTMRNMTNAGLVAKSVAAGLDMAYSTEQYGEALTREGVAQQIPFFRFYLECLDPFFLNYTAVKAGDVRSQLFYFSNLIPNPANNGQEVFLHPGAAVRETSLSPAADHTYSGLRKPFGIVEIELTQGLADTYRIYFRAKEAYWKYILVSEHLLGIEMPHVQKAGNGESFAQAYEVILPDRRQAKVLCSLEPISLRAIPENIFQLVDKAPTISGKQKVIIKNLPQPDVRTVSASLQEGKEANAFEIFI